MEVFTSGIVTAEQRKGYLYTHKWMRDAFTYIGHGKYRMIAWESQIDLCRATAPARARQDQLVRFTVEDPHRHALTLKPTQKDRGASELGEEA